MTPADWNTDFLDVVDCFEAEGVDFVVVGAFALAQHGVSRATGDLDLLIRPTVENARRVLSALRRFGAPLAGASEDDFARPGTVFQMGVVPRRIDVLTELTALSFDEVWATRVPHAVDGRLLSFVGEEAFLKNKRALGRPKDAADVDALEQLRSRKRRE
ncbi:MAG TPA: hypothetical protein VMB50_06335 [Myxococcales bacterium]|nr:hypothetical protein [Myxococcales bacterium]